ncbi:uncharacterized protein LTR77_003025 [Saxophila tyrrhenica]|uniref:ATP-dependent Clp protease proteolytic subunit n=1 Tax=Saxophila tyrrhenica TaxID=1690608 RepID=A0AAV9PHY5_9PEZI|nr:hypothetical protein LTR77_003025 [Saxophila tyrrhenica]
MIYITELGSDNYIVVLDQLSTSSHIMEPISRSVLRAVRSRPLRSGIRTATQSISSHPPFPSRNDANPPRPPSAAMPMPFVTETVGGGYHTYDIFSRLLRERVICLNGEIDEATSASIVAQLLVCEGDDPSKNINLYINSPGGSVTAGLAIYDTMQYIRAPVTTICLGQAASMGSLLLCGGSKGSRFCLPHARIMVHQVSGGYQGQASDITIHAKEILRVRDQLNKIYKKHLTKDHSIEDIEKIMERDFFMGAEEALEWGIIDKVLQPRSS